MILSTVGYVNNSSLVTETLSPAFSTSQDTSLTLMKLIDVIIGDVLTMMGVVTNFLVIAVFVRQGTRDSVSISLTTLAVWDLLKCFSGTVIRTNIPSWLNDKALGFSWDKITFSKLSYLHIMCTYVTYPLAAYVSVERALCVSIPLRVKYIVTPKLTTCLMLVISLSVSAMFLFTFSIFDIVYLYNEQFNTSVAQYIFSNFYMNHGTDYMEFYNIMGIINPVLSFIIIVISTITIIYYLQKSSRFRSRQILESSDQIKYRPMSLKDRRLLRMLLVVIVTFIVCLIPRIANQIAKTAEPEYYILRKYSNIFMVSIVVVSAFDFLNSSFNFFIFLAMSSSFKATFLTFFSSFRKTDSLLKVKRKKTSEKRNRREKLII